MTLVVLEVCRSVLKTGTGVDPRPYRVASVRFRRTVA